MMTREMYMTNNGELETDEQRTENHNKYFRQFVTPQIIDFVKSSIGYDSIKKSNDPHFNDIPLRKWDLLHDAIAMMTKDLRKKANEGLSLSTTCCIAKQAARIIKNEM